MTDGVLQAYFLLGCFVRYLILLSVVLFFCVVCLSLLISIPAKAKSCRNPSGIGVSRILTIDGSMDARFGRVQFGEKSLPLKRGEVVLTFDDGPLPHVTNRILKALARHCAKATFFAVGKMAEAAPHVAQRIIQEGHTLGSHTHSHPRDLRHHYFPYSRFQIERGFHDVLSAVGGPIAPFFRFPGLHDYPKMNSYLDERGIANFSVDIVPGDTDDISARAIIRRTLSQLRRRGKGIILLHDIKPATARALPGLLSALKRRGYRLVHIVPSKPFQPVPIVKLNEVYEKFNHRDPKTIIGGLTYFQLYGEAIRKRRYRKRRTKRHSR